MGGIQACATKAKATRCSRRSSRKSQLIQFLLRISRANLNSFDRHCKNGRSRLSNGARDTKVLLLKYGNCKSNGPRRSPKSAMFLRNSVNSGWQSLSTFSCVITPGIFAAKTNPGGVFSRQLETTWGGG